MSEEWKSDRAEASMREGTEAIRKAAAEKAKKEQMQGWEEVKSELMKLDASKRESIEMVIDLMKELYNLPEKKND